MLVDECSMSFTGNFLRSNSIIYIERIESESLAHEFLTFQQWFRCGMNDWQQVTRYCNAENHQTRTRIQGTIKLKCRAVDIALGSLRALYQNAGLVGERIFGTNCTSGAISQDKFATNTLGGSIPKAFFLTIGARGSSIHISGSVYDVG